jgi:hypothetical protein
LNSIEIALNQQADYFSTHLKIKLIKVIDILFSKCRFYEIRLENVDFKATLYSMQPFQVDDVSALEASSKPPVHIVEDSVTALATYAMTLVTAWMS